MSKPQRSRVSRRALLAGAGTVAGGTVAAGVTGWRAAAGAPTDRPAQFAPVTIREGDPRYDALLRGNNFRFVGQPDEIRVVTTTEQVVQAVADAADTKRRVAARSGGHCFENFTADPDTRMLLNLSAMDAVGYDPEMGAFAVQPGATLGQVYRTLYTGWGVTVPGGGCPDVGAGGHFVGGGYGPLSRRYGSVVDHLYAVEVVVADGDGARAVVATRDPDDPHHDLWWAHTGGGGGNFGVVTRYWMRTPDTPDDDPTRQLPAAPTEMLECQLVFPWEDMTEKSFSRLLRNFGAWHEHNSAADSPATGLYAILQPQHRSSGVNPLLVQIDAGLPNAERLVDDFVGELTAGVDVEPVVERVTMPWLHLMTWPGRGQPGNEHTRRYKIKAGYFRTSLTDEQIAAVYRNLTNDAGVPGCGMMLIGYGGRVRDVEPGATAVAQRDVVMKAVYHALWADEADDEAQLTWVRDLYRDVYAATGGAPVPDEVNDGSYINYPDTDLLDPELNTSGVPASTLYYKDNYPRLQRVKARWDPQGLFRHALSVEPA